MDATATPTHATEFLRYHGDVRSEGPLTLKMKSQEFPLHPHQIRRSSPSSWQLLPHLAPRDPTPVQLTGGRLGAETRSGLRLDASHPGGQAGHFSTNEHTRPRAHNWQKAADVDQEALVPAPIAL